MAAHSLSATPDIERPNGVYAVFFAEAFVLGNWIPRIPDVKALFGLSASGLGIMLFLLASGTLVAFLVGGSVIRRFGMRTCCAVALSLWAAGIGIVPQMPGVVALGTLLIFTGLAIGICEVGMNTAADDWERRSGRRMMSKAHGFWSLGTLAGALTGAGADAAGWSVGLHLGLTALISIAGGIWVSGGVRSGAPDGAAESTATFQLPRRDLMLLCLMPVGIMQVEGVFIDWSALFVEEVLAGSAFAVGAIYAAFSTVMAATRFSGDYLLERYGPSKVARFSSISATIGIGLFAVAPSVPVAFAAAVLCGLGVAIVYPLTMSAAARRPGDPAANVAAMSLFAFSSFMMGPPIIGAVADLVGLRYAFAGLVPLAFMSLALSGELKRKAAG